MKKNALNNKLVFNKSAVVELNDSQLLDVNGGTSSLATVSTLPCIIAVSVVTVSIVLAAE